MFLASFSPGSEQPAEPEPDDEGQSLGLNNEFVIGRELGRGGFGVVKEIRAVDNPRNGVVYAAKIVRKVVTGKTESENDRIQQDLEHEVSIWRHCKHTYIMGLEAVYETEFATFCLMDINIGGTLHDQVRIARSQSTDNGGRKALRPIQAINYSYQLASALRYLHRDIRVCHRDIKLENCLIDMTILDADQTGGHLRLCDFGLADFLQGDGAWVRSVVDPGLHARKLRQISRPMVIGTLEYASPEGLQANRKLYGTTGDIWAFGVVLYALCTGDLPFSHAIPSRLAEMIIRGEWNVGIFATEAGDVQRALPLIESCLQVDPAERATIDDVLDHEWFLECSKRWSGMEVSDVW